MSIKERTHLDAKFFHSSINVQDVAQIEKENFGASEFQHAVVAPSKQSIPCSTLIRRKSLDIYYQNPNHKTYPMATPEFRSAHEKVPREKSNKATAPLV